MKKRIHIYIVLSIFVLGLFLGSFFDLSINQAIFSNRNGFGIFMSVFGTLPAYAMCAFFGGIISCIGYKKEYKPIYKVLLIIFGIGCLAIGVYKQGEEMFSTNGYDIPKLEWLGYVITGALLLCVYILGIYLGRKVNLPNSWKITLVMAVVAVIGLVVLVLIMKNIMHRPRFRILVNDDPSRFYPWWKPASDLYKQFKDGLVPGVTKEEFKSFPSGHASGSAMTMMMLAYLPLFFPRLQKHQTLLFYLGFALCLIVCFSRILVGAHFLSDVSAGGIAFTISFLVGNEVIVRRFLK